MVICCGRTTEAIIIIRKENCLLYIECCVTPTLIGCFRKTGSIGEADRIILYVCNRQCIHTLNLLSDSSVVVLHKCVHTLKKKNQLKVLLKIQIRPLISWTGATGSQQTENVNYCRYVVIEKKLLFCNNRISVCPQFQHSNE